MPKMDHWLSDYNKNISKNEGALYQLQNTFPGAGKGNTDIDYQDVFLNSLYFPC